MVAVACEERSDDLSGVCHCRHWRSTSRWRAMTGEVATCPRPSTRTRHCRVVARIPV